ncbi:hypothetical protein [Bartonella sp. DGB2]|uniref:hypothetical protein n=1 Tax=Bartonella sp. DGB2 TaxID=3388426 RepID=UPI00398FADCB
MNMWKTIAALIVTLIVTLIATLINMWTTIATWINNNSALSTSLFTSFLALCSGLWSLYKGHCDKKEQKLMREEDRKEQKLMREEDRKEQKLMREEDRKAFNASINELQKENATLKGILDNFEKQNKIMENKLSALEKISEDSKEKVKILSEEYEIRRIKRLGPALKLITQYKKLSIKENDEYVRCLINLIVINVSTANIPVFNIKIANDNHFEFVENGCIITSGFKSFLGSSFLSVSPKPFIVEPKFIELTSIDKPSQNHTDDRFLSFQISPFDYRNYQLTVQCPKKHKYSRSKFTLEHESPVEKDQTLTIPFYMAETYPLITKEVIADIFDDTAIEYYRAMQNKTKTAVLYLLENFRLPISSAG